MNTNFPSIGHSSKGRKRLLRLLDGPGHKFLEIRPVNSESLAKETIKEKSHIIQKPRMKPWTFFVTRLGDLGNEAKSP